MNLRDAKGDRVTAETAPRRNDAVAGGARARTLPAACSPVIAAKGYPLRAGRLVAHTGARRQHALSFPGVNYASLLDDPRQRHRTRRSTAPSFGPGVAATGEESGFAASGLRFADWHL